MYTPKSFEISDPIIIKQFIKDTGFATLISHGGQFPSATHIPLEFELNKSNQEVLTGHIAKANPQWHEFQENPKVLVIFMSSIHSYISSSWYKNPDVPTWNYMSVHVSGTVKILTQIELENALDRIVNRYESTSKNPISWQALPKYIQAQIEYIVGIEIKIDKIEATFKLSQNKNLDDHERIINELRKSRDLNSRLLADFMADNYL